eukprot:scaffold148415_cov52-Attheya_sp.AAC.2
MMIGVALLLGSVVPKCRSATPLWGRSVRPTVVPRYIGREPLFTVVPRGGSSETVADASHTETEEMSLDDKVQAAMKRLGIDPPSAQDDHDDNDIVESESATATAVPSNVECKDGVCEIKEEQEEENVMDLGNRIAKEMNVDVSLAMAALGATHSSDATSPEYNESAARALIQQELDAMKSISEDCDEVKQLVSEGHGLFLARRALAFAEMNVDDARAILVADQEDEAEEREQEEQARLKAEEGLPMKTVNVAANFDPTAAAPGSAVKPAQPPQQTRAPPPAANKKDVVFNAKTSEIQKLVLESPVPVLLDVYADWCGPCKALTPVLEQMAVKAGGVFRLVKVNTDEERPVTNALEVTSLPTVYGIRDGKIINVFQGMPRDEEFMRKFMMELLVPSPTQKPDEKLMDLSTKLAKVAGAASFSFSARERLQDRTFTKLNELVATLDGDMGFADESATLLRSLLSNVIKDPYNPKFRRVNLLHPVIQAKVGKYSPCLAILKSVGFSSAEDGSMSIGKGKKVVNLAPLTVARDCIDKWIDKNRHAVAVANRKRKDEVERARLHAEGAFDEDEYDEYDNEEEEEIDPDACTLKLRMDGKKKVHDIAMRADDSLGDLLDLLPVKVKDGELVQITCAAKRLVLTSTDANAMKKTLREHGLIPIVSIVVKVGEGSSSSGKSSGLAARAAAQKENKKKTGTHTMQSIGIYSKDDNAKGELIDGGGGTCYEQDVTSDDEQEEEVEAQDDGVEESEENAEDEKE